MSRRIFAALAIGGLLATASSVGFAADPSLQQVYQAAESGHYAEAQGMMDQVLHDHPNSAKAHFVEAELLAKQGKTGEARAEFNTAKGLEPGLPFAKPEAVQELNRRLATAPADSAANLAARAPQPAPSLPWGLIAVVVLLVGAVMFFLRSRRQASTFMPAAAGGGGFGPQPYGYGNPGPMGPSGGMGSGIMGGLATGAAVGVGMVAAESLMHRVLDGGHSSNGGLLDNNAPLTDVQPQYDMGGNDFGVSDASSWDDSFSGGGGDDWS